jgi:hypothetical protein
MEVPHHILHDGEGALYPQNTTSSDANLPDVKHLWEGVPCQSRGKVEVNISILTVWLAAASKTPSPHTSNSRPKNRWEILKAQKIRFEPLRPQFEPK